MRDISDEWSFRANRIARENIGTHDADNRFLSKDIQIQLSTWRGTHQGCTPIGICYDESEENYGCYPMVYEDEAENDPEYPEYSQEQTDLWNELCDQAEQFLKEAEE